MSFLIFFLHTAGLTALKNQAVSTTPPSAEEVYDVLQGVIPYSYEPGGSCRQPWIKAEGRRDRKELTDLFVIESYQALFMLPFVLLVHLVIPTAGKR